MELTLWFEIESTPYSETSNSPLSPSAELGIHVENFDINNWVGCEYHHPGTIHDAEDSCDALFYYYEHQPLRDSHLTILPQSSADSFRIRWIGRNADCRSL